MMEVIHECLRSGMSTELIVEKLMAGGYCRMPQVSPHRPGRPSPSGGQHPSGCQIRAAPAPDMPSREDALREYGEHHGIVSVSGDGRLLYPSAEKLDALIAQIEKRIERISFNLRSTADPASPADPEDPLRIEHAFRKSMDSCYRSDAEAVTLPPNMLVDGRGRKVMEAFLHSPEYRKRLVAAADTGVARLFRRYSDCSFTEFVRARREKLLSEKSGLTSLLRCLLVLRQWATESAGKASRTSASSEPRAASV